MYLRSAISASQKPTLLPIFFAFFAVLFAAESQSRCRSVQRWLLLIKHVHALRSRDRFPQASTHRVCASASLCTTRYSFGLYRSSSRTGQALVALRFVES